MRAVFVPSVCLVLWLGFTGKSSLGADDTPAAAGESEAAGKAIEAELGQKGLRRQGASLVLVEEAELSKLLADEKKFKREVLKAAKAMNEALAFDYEAQLLLAQYRQQRRQLNAELPNASSVARHNRIVVMMNELAERITDLQNNKELADRVRVARQEFSKVREQYIERLLAARRLADKLREDWADLVEDADVKEIVARLSEATGRELALAESKSLQAMIKQIEKLEETVLSESIDLRNDGSNTYQVSVTVNGEHTKEMAVDSGSSIVVFPYREAEAMGVAPSEGAETIILVLADGRQVPAKRITIESVRVGKFVVENVEGAVLPAELTRAPLILGMSYLGNFKFDIDPGTMKLTMTRLDGDDLEPQRPGAKAKPGAKTKKKEADGTSKED
ncbi:MAG: TIGR02281 family clan AA aspartic protease [Pirellulales bacterium]|nr:TIGR02281 family clan AA aspartic protease [Pirellulales bacterium]